MLFNSFPFLFIFLPCALTAYWLLGRNAAWRVPLLLGLSVVFYGLWNPEFIPLLGALIVIDWAASRWFARTQDRRILAVAIVATLGVLAAYKYVDFFTGNVSRLTGVPIPALQLALPVGISFFTFHHIMYLSDLGRGRAQVAPLDRYALYICFFPQAAAGPLARWSEVGHQFGRDAFATGWQQRWALGITFIIVGLIEKVGFGDPIGRLISPIYHQALAGPVMDGSAWLALGFGFQIFFDFAGYSDMAIGIALLFGVRLPENFNAPFRATSVLVFWQRWHMTLSRFLRDYVFLPLADMRVAGTRHTTAQYVAAIMVTMSLCGLWHGAGWNFVLWGAVQGVAIVGALAWRRTGLRLPGPAAWALTAGLFLMSGILFRTPSLDAAWNVFAGLATAPGWKMLGSAWIIAAAIGGATVLPASRVICEWLVQQSSLLVPVLLGLAGIAIMVQLGGGDSYEFIYFRF